MGQDLQTQQEGKYLALAPREDARASAVLRSCLSGSYREFGTLMMQRPPEGDSRQVLVTRQKALVESLHSSAREMKPLIRDMLLGYRNKGVRPEENADQIVALYIRELLIDPKIPTWAVWRACSAIRSGTDMARLEKVGIRLYEAPTTMMLRALCDNFMWEMRAEMTNISDVLRGQQARPEVSAEEHAKTAEKFQALADEMKARNSAKSDLDAPLTVEQLAEMAGSQEAFDALPNIKPRKAQTVGGLVQKAIGA